MDDNSGKTPKSKSKSRNGAESPEKGIIASIESIETGSISKLNEALLTSILSSLNHFQLFRSSRVCHAWKKAILALNLNTLDLRTPNTNFEDEHLINLCTQFPNVVIGRINYAPRLTDKSMRKLLKLNLVELDLSSCINLTDNVFTKGPQGCLSRLTSLTLCHTSFSERVFKGFNFPALSNLDISQMDNLSSKFFQSLPTSMPVLTAITLSHCPTFQSEYLVELKNMQFLKSLTMISCPMIGTNGFIEFATNNGPAPLPPLTSLNISANLLNNDGLVKICKAYPQLTDLSFNYCYRIDDDGTSALNKLTLLNYLGMAYTGITMTTLNLIAKMPLKTVVISGCANVSDEAKSFAKSHTHMTVVYSFFTQPEP